MIEESFAHLALVRTADKALLRLAKTHDINSYFSATQTIVDEKTDEVVGWCPDPDEYAAANEYAEKVNELFVEHAVQDDFGNYCIDDNINFRIDTFFCGYYSLKNWNPYNQDDLQGTFLSENTIDFYQNHPLCRLSDRTLESLISKLEQVFNLPVDEYFKHVLSKRASIITSSIVFCAKSNAPYIDSLLLNPGKITYDSSVYNDDYTKCFIYDIEDVEMGITQSKLKEWAYDRKKLVEEDLKERFRQECTKPEKIILNTFIKYFWNQDSVPALLL